MTQSQKPLVGAGRAVFVVFIIFPLSHTVTGGTGDKEKIGFSQYGLQEFNYLRRLQASPVGRQIGKIRRAASGVK